MLVKCNKENFVESVGFVLTLIVISAFSISSMMRTTSAISEQENRELEPFPRIHTLRKDLPLFPAAFERYFCDRVAFRLNLITLRNSLCFKIFSSSGNPRVAIGRKNWLFYNSYGVLPAQLNLSTFTDEDLQVWVKDLEARKAFLADHGIKYLVVFPPEKGTMYPELLPPGWQRKPGQSRLDQLQTLLKEHSDVDVVDAKTILESEKKTGRQIYHSNDTHWNQRSAFLISQEILRHLSNQSLNVAPAIGSEILDGHSPFQGDLAKMLGLQQLFLDDSPSIVMNRAPQAVPADTNIRLAKMDSLSPPEATSLANNTLPRALVLRDSFCTYLKAPLAEHFRFCEFQWTNRFDTDAILGQHPDVVINEIAERHLYEEFSEHTPSFLKASADQQFICSFDNRLELLNLTAVKTLRGITLQLKWRSRSAIALDYTVSVHCLDEKEKLIGGANYSPDILRREIKAKEVWLDTLKIPDRELKASSRLGIIVLDKAQIALPCSVASGNWNSRFILSIEDLKEDGQKKLVLGEHPVLN